jgi:exonuclease SbcC
VKQQRVLIIDWWTKLKRFWSFDMILKKIILNNIRSYENQEIDFSLGSTLLSGNIGSGKTSILLGIEFALFGLQPGQKGIALLRGGKDKGGVKIIFEVDGKKIILERTLKRNKTISQDYCSITINDEKKEISVSELKSKILEILNYPKEFAKKQNILYKFTVYTPQEEMKQIILQDSETRMNTLRHVFGIDKYKKILENSSIVASKLRERKRLNQGRIFSLENDKLDLFAKQGELKMKDSELILVEKDFFIKRDKRKKIQEEQEKISNKIEERKNLNQEIEKTNIVIGNKKQNLLENKKIVQELNNQIKELLNLKFDESKIQEIELKISMKKKEKEKTNQDLLLIHSEINSLNLKIEENKKLEGKISNLEICPTCLQDVDAIYRANVLNKIHKDFAGLNGKISELESRKIILNDLNKNISIEIFSKEKEINNLKILKIKIQNVEEKKVRLKEIEELNLSLEKDIYLLKNHIESLISSIKELNKFDLIFETTKKELQESLRQEKLFEIKTAELKKEIEVFSKQIEESKEKIAKLENIKQKLGYIIGLEDWLSRKFIPAISYVEKNVMVRLKSEFSNLFEKWFSMLVSDSFNVSLRDDFTPIIEQQDYEIDYAYLSGGERTAVALAYRLALNQVINSLLSKIKTRSLVILDEPTDGFSDQQLDKMRDVLQELNVEQLIIVSHEQKIESFVENVVRFKKENNISRKE